MPNDQLPERNAGFIRAGVTGYLCVFLSGCAVVHPYVAERHESPTHYADAVAQADSLSEEISHKRQVLHDFDFWTGAALVGTGIAAAGLGAYGANKDALIGTALGAGALVGARTYVPIRTRQGIYNTAQETIAKAIEDTAEIPKKSVAPMRALDLPAALSGSVPAASALYQRMVETESAVGETEKKLNDFNDEKNRAKLLMDALRKVVATANKALVDEVLDPSGAISAATNAIGNARNSVKQQKEKAARALERLEDRVEISQFMVSQEVKALPEDSRPGAKSASDSFMTQVASKVLDFQKRLDAIGADL